VTGARADDEAVTAPLAPDPVASSADTGGDAAAPIAPSPCPRCNAPTVAGDRFCESCGTDLRVHRGGTSAAARGLAARPCPHCGDRSAPEEPDGFCPSCGMRRPDGTDRVETALDGAAALSDRGHVRSRNEDAVALGRAAAEGAGQDAVGAPAPVAAVVCDGVSSVPNSERAARAAADAALEHLLRTSGTAGTGGERRTRAAVAAAAAAAAAVVPAGTRNAPSCTLVCGLVEPAAATVTVGWVGDSRAYWLAGDAGGQPGDPPRLLTRDHVAANAAPGTLDPAVVAARPDAITRWLGADGEPEPDVVTLAPAGPGLLLLCSDGLWKYVPDAPDLAALAFPALRAGGPTAVAAALVEAALAAGGEDNVTVAVIPVPLSRRSSP
jgi:serine/threonine protein phosphatase PrpC